MSVKEATPVIRTSHFGLWLDFGFKYAQAIVLAYNDGGGIIPFRLLLAHQLYLHDLSQLREKHQEIYVLPVSSDVDWQRIPSSIPNAPKLPEPVA